MVSDAAGSRHHQGRDGVQPRKPERANGRIRYEMLLNAAERILIRNDSDGLTIRKLATEADVPMASVYHFFPGPPAISIGLAERYMEEIAELVGRPIPDRATMDWAGVVAALWARIVQFYRAHPYAQTLVLGSGHSWHIRRADLANNRAIAGTIARLTDKFPGVASDLLRDTIAVAISVGDAVLTLSVSLEGEITPRYEREAVTAVCGYIARRLNLPNQ